VLFVGCFVSVFGFGVGCFFCVYVGWVVFVWVCVCGVVFVGLFLLSLCGLFCACLRFGQAVLFGVVTLVFVCVILVLIVSWFKLCNCSVYMQLTKS